MLPGNIAEMNQYVKPRGLPERISLKHACPLSELELDSTKLSKLYDDILQPLTLFPTPFSALEKKKEKRLTRKSIHRITEDVHIAKITLTSLCYLIRKRLYVDATFTEISAEVQHVFEDIILEKVKSIFKTFQQNIPDPTLSTLENMELNHRIILYILTVCEQLFLHYVYMMELHKDDPVFSEQATFSHLKAQLLLDCSKFLNILGVKGLLIEDIKAMQSSTVDIGASNVRVLKKIPLQRPRFWSTQYDDYKDVGLENFDSLFTVEQFIKFRSSNLQYEQEIAEICSEVEKTRLDLQMNGLVPGMVKTADTFRKKPYKVIRTPRQSQDVHDSVIASGVMSEEIPIMIKKSHSLPDLSAGDMLSQVSEAKLPHSESSAMLHEKAVQENVEDDLKWLMQDFGIKYIQRSEDQNDETDIPPLIKVLTYNRKHASKLQKLEQALKDFDEKDKFENLEEQNIEVQTHPQSAERNLIMTGKTFVEPFDKQFPVHSSKFQKYSPVYHDLPGKGLYQKDKQECLGEELKLENQSPFQPATRDFKMPNKPLVKTADVQFSSKIYIDSPEFHKHLPIYNDLFLEELDACTVNQMDRKLFLGSRLIKVYKEFIENIPKEHLILDEDPVLEFTSFNTELSQYMASSILTRKSKERAINEELRELGQNIQSSGLLSVADISLKEQKQPNLSSSWLLWWKTTMNSNDYFEYASTQDSDYLSTIFHFYDSESDEDEGEKTTGITSYQAMEREKDKKLAELKAKESEYIPGLWNVSSSTLATYEAETFLEGYKHVQSPQTALQIPETVKDVAQSQIFKESTEDDELQQKRLESIWRDLHFPYHERLDMAIKYSSSEYQGHLKKILIDWKKAVNLIQRREELLRRLEIFERTASDPNRLFQRGYKATFLARIKESRKRKYLHSQISEIETELLKILHWLKKKFNDTVSYKGRPYLEKMQWDKIEMLYWLQQERREISMEPLVHREKMRFKLPPMNTPQL